MSRALALLLLLAGSSATTASTPALDERSPFRPGLWWNAERPGSGFDIHRVDQDIFLIWYTFLDDGSPVWYTAQGTLENDRLQSALLVHRWADGAYAGYSEAGSIELTIATAESMLLNWTLDEGAGAWSLQPFIVDAGVPEIDHSGAWYQPERPGFGLTLSEQGEFLFSAVYYYDGNGQPVWAVGDNAFEGSAFALQRFSGSCPGCSQQAPVASPAGQMTLRTANGRSMEVDLDVPAAADAPWAQTGQTYEILTPPGSERAADRMLVRAGSEAVLADQLRRALLAIHVDHTFRGGIDFSASPPPPPVSEGAFSGTNLQELGVDEAALLVSDGAWVFAQEQGRESPAPGRVRLARIDPAQVEVESVDEFPIALDPRLRRPQAKGLLLDSERLVAIHGEEMLAHLSVGLWIDPWPWTEGTFQVDILARTEGNLSAPTWTASIDGYLLAARRVGDQLLLIHRHTTHVPGLVFAGSDPQLQAANSSLLEDIDGADLLPQIRINGADPQPLVDADSVLLPPTTDLGPRPDLMLLTRVNLADPGDFESIAVLGYLEAFYASTEAVYLASSRYQPEIDEVLGISRPGKTSTDLHKIALQDGRLDYRASGIVEGFLHWDPDRAAFRLSEHEGRLRVLTQSFEDIWGAFGRHRLGVLEESTVTSGLLRTVSTLPNRGRPEPIGKPGELLYGTRYVGDRLYAVTFLTIDPLYVIDLSDPADPFIAGEVELPGFSDYLHPLPDGILLGVGHDAIEEIGWNGMPFAWFQGLKLSLFDVSDPGAPRVLQEMSLGKRGSESALLAHHHGFSILPGDGVRPTRFAIPMALHGEGVVQNPSNPPSTVYPWSRSGQFRFEFEGEGAATRIRALDPLITRDSASGGVTGWSDGGRRGGRSLLLEGGSLYLDGDRFWLADWDAPAAVRGPY